MDPETPVAGLIQNLAEDFPGVPFVALGQTALWDEPMKAVWRRLLDRYYPDARMIVGVHDTDYFAKTTALIHADTPYVSLPHDDVLTQGLWSAAGELSALFGSEDVPTRAAYRKHAVPIDLLAQADRNDKLRFLSEYTSAWGWRGIVDTRPGQRIVADVAMREFSETLYEQLRWGFDLSIGSLAEHLRPAAMQMRDSVLRAIEETAGQSPESRLNDVYERLLPRLYALLLGGEARNLETSRSTRLFRFNSQTYALPRFRFVGLFLDTQTAAHCRRAYNSAVAGGGMYSLTEFGPNALPFDVVVPGIGRGTLHVSSSRVKVDFPGSAAFEATGMVTDLASLAKALEHGLGPEVVLIGKAVSLISMLAAEFLIVFHETASGYTDRTTAMNDAIRAAGIELNLNPIVRLQYPTWDALSVLGNAAAFELPPHLARAFGKRGISASEFSERWRTVVSEQRALLSRLQSTRTTRKLLDFVEATGDDSRCWPCNRDKYERIQAKLADCSLELAPLKSYLAELKAEVRSQRARLAELQRESGTHFRSAVQPLRAAIDECSGGSQLAELSKELEREVAVRETRFTKPIAEAIVQIRQWRRVIKQLRWELRQSERAERQSTLRAESESIVLEAEQARLEIVRTAMIATTSLPHTQSRPTAWWIPLVDGSGAWFKAIADGASARIERL